ncbi:MAG: ribonuclease P protein component [Candidatus Dormibacteraceae bacterium]
MQKRHRIVRGQDFQRVMSGSRVHAGHGLVAFARPRVEGPTRVGVTSSRRVKGAVARNRARRRLREVARLHLLGGDSPLRGTGIAYDVVLIARPEALALPFAALAAEVIAFRKRLESG